MICLPLTSTTFVWPAVTWVMSRAHLQSIRWQRWQPGRGPFPALAARCARGQALKALDTAGAHKHQLLSRARSLDSGQQRPRAGLRAYDQTFFLMASRAQFKP